MILPVLIILLYLLAIAPRMAGRPDFEPLFSKGIYYAHRGLHDNRSQAPENSMAAFQKAVEAGYGIELDVQLTRDRIAVVFHDETLSRVCGVEGKVRDYTYEQLRSFYLCGTQERIPLFADVLALVDGQVPLIIELKAYENPETVCRLADQLISAYQGPYCIESFHPFAVRWYRKHRPQVIRGQLASNFNRPERREPVHEAMVHHLLTNFLSRPDFIAYDHQYEGNLSRRLCCRLFRALAVTWTIKSPQQLEKVKDKFRLFIFEGFRPEA
ncbi:MAG: glycerophosphodiester phosphodiesterase [Oscillospiraceae bacterium]|nr:glycerophosphodiester phosphodiesterase [Oscillospiraceae bacterium]